MMHDEQELSIPENTDLDLRSTAKQLHEAQQQSIEKDCSASSTSRNRLARCVHQLLEEELMQQERNYRKRTLDLQVMFPSDVDEDEKLRKKIPELGLMLASKRFRFTGDQKSDDLNACLAGVSDAPRIMEFLAAPHHRASALVARMADPGLASVTEETALSTTLNNISLQEAQQSSPAESGISRSVLKARRRLSNTEKNN